MNAPDALPSLDFLPALNQIWDFFSTFWPSFLVFIKNLIGFLIGLSIPVSIFLVILIVYCVEQLKRIRIKESEKFDLKIEPAIEDVDRAPDIALSKRWESVKKHMESDNQNDWRQAIMDSDIILDELLNKMGYRGASVGEKLKRVAKGDFVTLDDAWEAHKIRNQIAHEGTNFSLNHHEANRVIGMYRKVFDEFYYI